MTEREINPVACSADHTVKAAPFLSLPTASAR